ncbi:MAG: hypothetical protein DMG70_28640 [Acidobacteria bacterium]|nr:MAG: hypothetical protein DMG70_28640 [Acidobacteriota bacterium]
MLIFSERLQEICTGFERPFWVANISEIFERLSYYGAFASLALYLQERLNFSTEQTGTLTGLFGGMVWFLATFGGAAADRLGFRRALSLAYLILSVAYFLIGSIGASWLAPARNAVPISLFVGFILILPALGISLVKPCVVGTTARASSENVRSIGYSIYYTMVNIGGAAGPYFASWAHRRLGVENVYRVAALSVFAMFFVVLFFFREPRKNGDAPVPSIAQVARNFCLVLGNYRLVLPVLILSLVLRITEWVYPRVAMPGWIWVGLLVLVLAGISRFMWFLVLFTGYWIVFWQQYISLPGFIHRYIDASADVELILVTDGLTVICLTLAVNFLSSDHFGHGDYIYRLADSRLATGGRERSALTLCTCLGRDHSVAALLRVYFAAGAARPARHLHGIRVSSDRNRIADRRLVRRNAAPSFRRGQEPASGYVDRRYRNRAAYGRGAVDL